MGFFDTYIPQPPLQCPVCRKELRDWQGKGGPCLQLVWTQGTQPPRATDLDVDVAGVCLPDEFLIYSYDCACFEHGVEAIGRCVDGVWRSTEHLTAELVERFHYELPKAERAARADELRRAGLQGAVFLGAEQVVEQVARGHLHYTSHLFTTRTVEDVVRELHERRTNVNGEHISFEVDRSR